MPRRLLILLLTLPLTTGFHTPTPLFSSATRTIASRSSPSLTPCFHSRRYSPITDDQNQDDDRNATPVWRRVLQRFDTTTAAGIPDAKGAGLLQRIKGLHGPVTYLALALMAGIKWRWCFRNPYYWFGVAFCIKWYRARYVFKIPVWDRQPNWNNIITNKEQEKDLKAYTCLTCGATLFIAKTREFFFEGDTGIGGLGCFSCGTKGKDNFVMDRDRIVEDVADMDDYFEYERPLDFVSRAERRKILKETGGDEDKANQLLLERAGAASTPAPQVNGDTKEEQESIVDAEVVEETSDVDDNETEDKSTEDSAPAEPEIPPTDEPAKAESEPEVKKESTQNKDEPKPKKKKKKKKASPKKSEPVAEEPAPSLDDLDVLDMDSF